MEHPFDAPRDRWNITFFATLLLGVASLLPWNFFITSNDYWMYKFRTINHTCASPLGSAGADSSTANIGDLPTQSGAGPTVCSWEELDPVVSSTRNEMQRFFSIYLSITSNGVFIIALGLNALVSKRVSSNIRIVVPLFITIILFVLTTALVKVDTDQHQLLFLGVTLVIVALMNVLVAFLMGASMGICGYMPSRFMAVCSLGQAVGGLVCCATQVATLLIGLGHQDTALLYFSTAVIILAATLAVYRAMVKTEFFQHYSYLAKDSEISASTVETIRSIPYWSIFKEGWQFHVSSFLVYAVTLAFFPGIAVLAVSTHYQRGDMLSDKLFLPLACFTVFNIADCVGRYMVNYVQMSSRSGSLLLLLCLIRVLFVPLVLVCNLVPLDRHHTPVLLDSDIAFIVLMILAGLSNGYLISLAFVHAPKTVPVEQQELSASLVSFFAGVGSTVGAILSYGVAWLL